MTSNEPSDRGRRWKSTLVERDRYREALDQARDKLWAMLHDARHRGVAPGLESIEAVAKVVDSAWRFRQHSCPRCDEPCDFSFAMIMVGPHVSLWSCKGCGRIRREGSGGEYVLLDSGEVLRLEKEEEALAEFRAEVDSMAVQPGAGCMTVESGMADIVAASAFIDGRRYATRGAPPPGARRVTLYPEPESRSIDDPAEAERLRDALRHIRDIPNTCMGSDAYQLRRMREVAAGALDE